MKMLKKFAVVLLLSGSCGLQAMHGGDVVEWHDTNNDNHYRQHSGMYEDDGVNMSSIRLRDEFDSPEKIAALRAKQTAAAEVARVEADRQAAAARSWAEYQAREAAKPDTSSVFTNVYYQGDDGQGVKDATVHEKALQRIIDGVDARNFLERKGRAVDETTLSPEVARIREQQNAVRRQEYEEMITRNRLAQKEARAAALRAEDAAMAARAAREAEKIRNAREYMSQFNSATRK